MTTLKEYIALIKSPAFPNIIWEQQDLLFRAKVVGTRKEEFGETAYDALFATLFLHCNISACDARSICEEKFRVNPPLVGYNKWQPICSVIAKPFVFNPLNPEYNEQYKNAKAVLVEGKRRRWYEWEKLRDSTLVRSYSMESLRSALIRDAVVTARVKAARIGVDDYYALPVMPHRLAVHSVLYEERFSWEWVYRLK